MSGDWDNVDWASAARKFAEIQGDMLHREQPGLHGDDFWAEALRRLFGRIGHELWPVAGPEPAEQLHAGCWAALESSERQAREQYARFTAALAAGGKTYAAHLRAKCNEVTVPSRYRREGVLIAASWLDGEEGLTRDDED